MSRSRKKPVIKLKNSKFYKKWFNKKIRRNKISYKGMDYKKVNSTWDICDLNMGELSKEELEKLGQDKYKVIMK